MIRLFEEDLYEGMVCEANFKTATDVVWTTQYIPIRIDKEYPRYYLCTVIPHLSKDSRRMGMSSPYRMTIDKHNLRVGDVVCRTMQA